MKYLKTHVILFILVFSFKSKAQDLITQKDGSKIYCKISKVDSSGIYYLVPGEMQQLMISSVDVESYYILQSLPTSTTSVETASSVVSPAPIPSTSAQKSYTVVHKSLMPSKLPPKKDSSSDLFIVNFCGGMALPISDFGNKNGDVATAGLAKLGYVIVPEVILKFTKHLGISASYHYQSNSISNTSLNNTYSSNSPGVIFVIKSKPWQNYGFFVGLLFDSPINNVKGLSMFSTFSFGYLTFNSPELLVTGRYGVSYATVFQQAGEVQKFGYYQSLGFKQKISEDFGINFSVNYLAANPYFSNVGVSGTNVAKNTSIKFSQKIETINFKLGLSFFIH